MLSPNCMLLFKFELNANLIKICTPSFPGKDNTSDNSSKRRSGSTGHTTLPAAVLPLVLPRGLPPALFMFPASLKEFEGNSYFRFYITFTVLFLPPLHSPTFLSHFPPFPTDRLYILEMPQTVFLKYLTFFLSCKLWVDPCPRTHSIILSLLATV